MTTTESVHMRLQEIVTGANCEARQPDGDAAVFATLNKNLSVFFSLSLALSYIDIQKALVWFIKIMPLCHRAILAMGKSVDSGLAPYVCS